MAPERRLTKEEERLWRTVARTVQPLDSARPPPEAEAEAAPPNLAPDQACRTEPPPPSRRHVTTPGPTNARMDRRTAQRLKRGRLPIDRSFDLHGHTQGTGHAALLRFVAGARAEGCRHVLIVTGRGREGTGVLKRSVPRWLAEPAFTRHVTAFQEAGPRHGGEGALYVTLRRRD